MLESTRTEAARPVSVPVAVPVARSTQTVSHAPAIERESSVLEWEPVADVLPQSWAGRVRGTFVGMVETAGADGFMAITRLGRQLGTFDTLEAAQESFILRKPTR